MKEDLLKPRYKAIADYPNAQFEIGEIIDGEDAALLSISDEWKYQLKDYPALFKKLEWWEERQESEMPEYVKSKSRKVFKIVGYGPTASKVFHFGWHNSKGSLITQPAKNLLPATQSEYEQFTSKQIK